MQSIRHWQDVVNAFLGLALVASPWVLGYDGLSMAMSNAVVLGLALAAVSLGAVVTPAAWEDWTEAGIGLWLAVAPWVLGFGHDTRAMAAHVVIGLVVLALAAWALATDREYTPWLRRDRAVP